jgi:hypothetical protein
MQPSVPANGSRLVLPALLLAALLTLSPGQAGKKPPSAPAGAALRASLLTSPGDAALLRAGKVVKPLKKGAVIKSGDVLRTGKTGVDIRFGSGAVVRVKPRTRVRFPTVLRQSKNDPLTVDTRLNLDEGTVLARLERLLGKSRFVIVTPRAVTAVRGTAYLVDAGRDRTQVLVDQGAVTVKLQEDAPRELLVAAREKAAVVGDRLPERPAPLTDKDELRVRELRQLALPERGASGITYWARGPAGSTAPGLRWIEARDLVLRSPDSMTVGPDGTVYLSDEEVVDGRNVASIWMLRRGKAARLIGPGRPGFDPRRPAIGCPVELAAGAGGELLMVALGGTEVLVVDTAGRVSSVAGGDEAGEGDGPRRAARFREIEDLAVMPDGAIAVLDRWPRTNAVRLIRPEHVTTLRAAGGAPVNARLLSPLDATTLVGRGDGNLMIAIDVLGGGVRPLLSDRIRSGNNPWLDGPAEQAFLLDFRTLTCAGGRVYVDQTDYNLIRVLDPGTKSVGTVAGTGFAESQDGPAAKAAFDGIHDLATGPGGDIFILESGTHRVRVLSRDGMVRTLSGQAWEHPNPPPYGLRDGPAAKARILSPELAGRSAAGDWYFFDHYHRLRRLTAAGVVETVAGSGRRGERQGQGLEADVWPSTTVLADGTVLHSRGATGTIWGVSPSGEVRDVYRFPLGGEIQRFAADPDGTYYIEYDVGVLYRVKPGGSPEYLAGEPRMLGSRDGRGKDARLHIDTMHPGKHGLYVIERIQHNTPNESRRLVRLVEGEGNVRTIAGSSRRGLQDGQGRQATFEDMSPVGVDAAGNLYVLDGGERRAIRRITPAGEVTTLLQSLALPPSTNYLVSLAVEGPDRFIVGTAPPGRLLRLTLPARLEVIAGPPLP